MSPIRSRLLTKLTLLATAAMTIITTFASCLTVPATAVGTAFKDISDSYAYQSITSLHAKGILAGTQPGYFSPKRRLQEPNGLPRWIAHSVWSLYKHRSPPIGMYPNKPGTTDGLKQPPSLTWCRAERPPRFNPTAL